MYISEIILRKILDSRGNPTVEAEVITTEGIVGRAAAPSGASRGKTEVVAFPEGSVDKGIQYFYDNVYEELLEVCVFDQELVDEILHEKDGTENFANLGGNVAVAISLANAKAAANTLGIPLYEYFGGHFLDPVTRPMGNVLGGGKHAIGGTDIQEFLSVALGPTIEDSVFANARVHQELGKILKEHLPGEAIGKGDEGAWVAKVKNEEAIQLVLKAIEKVSDETGVKIRLGLDFAASEFYRDGYYVYKEEVWKGKNKLTQEEQIEFVAELVDKYDLISVEDPLDEEDFEGFAELTKQIGNKCYVIGDDIFMTNYERIRKGLEMGAANGVLIKPNQIGTLTDTIRAIKLTKSYGCIPVVSHRSGETTDETIAHIAIGFQAPFIKTGAISGERIAKLNELIRIEENLY